MQFGTDAEILGLAGPIHDAVRRAIVTMELPPGAVIDPKALAEMHGVSPTPVREALGRLQQEGLVRIHPQSRTVVTHIHLGHIQEAHFLRMAVETEVTRSVAEAPRQDMITDARRTISLQEGAAVSGRSEAFQHFGQQFHHTLFDAAGRAGLQLILRRKGAVIERIETLHTPEAEDDILEAHDGIVAAIARRDGDRAVEVMRRHLNPVIAHIDTLQKRYPRSFVP